MDSNKTARSRAWNFPTSPRSPYKIQAELKLLKNFDGKEWNEESQLAFADLLQSSEAYRGNVSKKEKAFAARDRLRGPKLMGFILIPKRSGANKNLEFTDVGNLFLDANPDEQILIFQRQMSKVQYRSHLHNIKGFEDMNIRPLTLMIKLLLNLGKLTKKEIAIFALTTTDYRNTDNVIEKINSYRLSIKEKKAGIERKTFKINFMNEYVLNVYKADIDSGRSQLREGGTNFVKTKIQTLNDYADSSIRYLRATGLFTLQPHGQSLVLTQSKIEDAKFLLDNYGLQISANSDIEYNDYIKNYLGNPSVPILRRDNKENQYSDLLRMSSFISTTDANFAKNINEQFNNAQSSTEKLTVLIKLEKKITEIQLKNEAKMIRKDFHESLTDIKKIFNDISSRDAELVDRPLMYEWNTWRSMVLINDAVNVQGNYIADADGNPVSTAPSNKPDILVEYEHFWLAVEVTLQSGMKQYENEGEPITRHVGSLQRDRFEQGDKRPVYGIFIAEKINDEVINHIYSTSFRNSQTYKGKVRIIPIERATFVELVESILALPNFSNKIFMNFFEKVFEEKLSNIGELEWFSLIKDCVKKIN